ncbi:MAG: ABC transporter ATP-binding protein [Candidatus Bipolaricaulia bacterium]
MTNSDVVFNKVTKVFSEGSAREVYAVDEVDFEVTQGKFVSLLGPSGCGKTTTLRLIAGFEFPTSGDIFLRGDRVNDTPPQKRNVAMVFQSYGLFPHMTVEGNVSYGLKVQGLSKNEIRGRVSDSLDLVDLSGLEDRSVEQLSGGQQQRVALCRALVTQPDVMLFDEPISNLDAKLRKGTREQVRSIQQELEITSVYVTHDQTEAMSIADELMIMHEGKIRQVGKPDEIYARPQSEFVADFIGEANFLDGSIINVEDHVEVDLTNIPLKNNLHFNQVNSFSTGDNVQVLVRPEAVDITEVDTGDFNGKVQFSHYTGATATYSIKLEEGSEIDVQVANPQEQGLLSEGDQIGLKLHRNSLHILPKG